VKHLWAVTRTIIGTVIILTFNRKIIHAIQFGCQMVENSCIPLWGECTNQNDNCCDPASCYVNDVVGSYAQCVPSCIECTDEEDPILIQYGYECEEADRYLVRRCNTHPVWSTEKYCQLSCYNLGLGYDGDLCCNGTT